MSNESKALELAADVDDVAKIYPAMAEVSAELRRQHAEIESLRAQLAARVPDADEMASQIRWISGASKMGAGALAEHLCDWIASRFSAAPAQQAPVAQIDLAFSEASALATSLFKKHFANTEPYKSGEVVWGLCDTTAGIISQIDNMVSGLVMPVAQGEPVAAVHINSINGMPSVHFNGIRTLHHGDLLYTTPQQASEPMTDADAFQAGFRAGYERRDAEVKGALA